MIFQKEVTPFSVFCFACFSPALSLLNFSIAAALSRNHHLLSLDLWNNDMGERGAGAISEAMSMNTTLQELDLGSNAIMDSGFLVVVNALGSSSLVKLLCRVNQIGEHPADYVWISLMMHQVCWVFKDLLRRFPSFSAFASCTYGEMISHPAGVKLPSSLLFPRTAHSICR